MSAAAAALDFQVARGELRRCRLVETVVPEPQDGEALLRIERFALTANNITYGVFGDAMQYWQFFPAPEGWGRIPVWGFATVVRSRSPQIAEGERVYGYLPMATHLVVQPGRIAETTFMDGSAHRRALPAAYQLYRRVSKDTTHDPQHEDQQALLSPLFITSFLIEDFLADNALFGARSVVIASASSKTALGVAHRLSKNRPQSCEVIGLTSARNRAFCEGLGHYDRVVTYDALESLPADTPSVYVDMAGDGALLARVHNHFRDALRYSCIVGATHWEQRGTQHQLPGAKPQFFFAPAQIKKRTQDWGPGGVDQRFAEAWQAFLPSLSRWLRVQRSPAAQIETVYREVLEGRSTPETGHIVTWDS